MFVVIFTVQKYIYEQNNHRNAQHEIQDESYSGSAFNIVNANFFIPIKNVYGNFTKLQNKVPDVKLLDGEKSFKIIMLYFSLIC